MSDDASGYVLPLPTTPPLEGTLLDNLLHDIVARITGLDDRLVFPRWQSEPPNIPAPATAWASVGVPRRNADTFPAVLHGDNYDELQRHQRLFVLASFYDLGAGGDTDDLGGQADAYAGLLRDGLAIEINRSELWANGFALVDIGEQTPVPTLTAKRWLYRVDLPFTLRRQITRAYQIPNIESAEGTISNDKRTIPFTVIPEE